MNFLRLFSFLVLIVLIICTSCKKKNVQKADNVTVEVAETDTTKLWIDIPNVNSMTILYGDDEQNIEKTMNKNDETLLQSWVSTAEYDTIWNKSGIMIKMTAPEYIVIINYKDKSADNNDWLMLWKENSKIKFKNTWFNLSVDSRNKILSLLESYRDR